MPKTALEDFRRRVTSGSQLSVQFFTNGGVTHISFTAAQIAEHLREEVVGDGSVQLTGFAPTDSAKAGDFTFAEKQTYFGWNVAPGRVKTYKPQSDVD